MVYNGGEDGDWEDGLNAHLWLRQEQSRPLYLNSKPLWNWFTKGKYKAEEIYVLRMKEGREPGFNDGSL